MKNEVLATVEGVFSTERFTQKKGYIYTEECLNNIAQTINSQLVFGCFGQKEEPITEQDIESGNVSHYVSDAIVEDKKIKVKIGLLKTPSGKVVFEALKRLNIGCVNVTARAKGHILNDNIIDPDRYDLFGMDILASDFFKKEKEVEINSLANQVKTLPPASEIEVMDLKNSKKYDDVLASYSQYLPQTFLDSWQLKQKNYLPKEYQQKAMEQAEAKRDKKRLKNLKALEIEKFKTWASNPDGKFEFYYLTLPELKDTKFYKSLDVSTRVNLFPFLVFVHDDDSKTTLVVI